MTCPDCHPAYVAGLEQGRAERVKIDLGDQVQVALHRRVCEALGLARRSTVNGAAFSSLIAESGERP